MASCLNWALNNATRFLSAWYWPRNFRWNREPLRKYGIWHEKKMSPDIATNWAMPNSHWTCIRSRNAACLDLRGTYKQSSRWIVATEHCVRCRAATIWNSEQIFHISAGSAVLCCRTRTSRRECGRPLTDPCTLHWWRFDSSPTRCRRSRRWRAMSRSCSWCDRQVEREVS